MKRIGIIAVAFFAANAAALPTVAVRLSLMSLRMRGAICDRPAHDHWTISASSGQHTAHYLPAMIAPFLDQFIETVFRKNWGAFIGPPHLNRSRPRSALI
jgi:hypothetical protein